MSFDYKYTMLVTIFICIILQRSSAIAHDKIHIKSNYLKIDTVDLTATFYGAVVITFEELQLYCSTVTVYFTKKSQKKRDIKRIIIPTTLTVINRWGQKMFIADSGYFDNKTQNVILLGNVQILKEDNILVTDKLVYSYTTKKK